MSSMFEREATFRGICCQDIAGKWHFDDSPVKTTALYKRVLCMFEEDGGEIVGVITNYEEHDGWCIIGNNFAGKDRETWIPVLSREPVYLVTGPTLDKQPAQPARPAPKLFQNNEFDTIPDQ
jgi:hypothetical protein